MNDSVRHARIAIALLTAALLLTAAAWLRGAEYDEQYTLFLTGHVARPVWPAEAITAGTVQDLQCPRASLADIARDLRTTDVHPPLYFWTMAAWRRLAGSSLFAARLASVLFGVVTLGLVAVIARSAAIPPIPAVALTLGSYAFAYTSAIARGFALSQMLSVAGVALLLGSRRGTWRMAAAGLLLGAATFANYLALFVACGALLALWMEALPAIHRGTATLAFAIWLPADAWFFLAQRHARVGQFEPFQPVSAVIRLGRYIAASVFGGLPLYVDGIVRSLVTVALLLLLLIMLAFAVARWRRIGTPASRRLLAIAAVAPPFGLLLLGFIFDNTPIELRYLAFATPFLALLWAAALPSCLRYAVLTVQAVALLGLMTRPETMQPARAAASEVARLVGDGVALVPLGNDGVGIIGAFAAESVPSLRMIVVGRDVTPGQIRVRASQYRRVVLALLDQDAASRATLPIMIEAFGDPCWRAAGEGSNVLAFDQVCRGS